MEKIREQVIAAVEELLEEADLREHDILVLGASSSEVQGSKIGQNSSQDVGETIVSTLLPILRDRGIYLAVQGCEHINRALVVERACARRYHLEEVTVIPQLHAGGACAVAAYNHAEDPVMVEHIKADAGIDIGGVLIGMHLKETAVPLKLKNKFIGEARIIAARTRPKFIGGVRAVYDENLL